MKAITEVKIFDKPNNVYTAVANELHALTHKSAQERFDIILSGGNTPTELFRLLGNNFTDSIPWEKIHFWWGDERCVSPDSTESNYKTAYDNLLSKIRIPLENIHRIKGENEPEQEALRYTKELEKNVNSREGNPVADLVLLGLGEDGHTVSIFPDQIELFEDERICAVTEHPITGQKRITLTGRVLNNANRVFFLVTGNNKAQRISEIMNDDEAAKLLPAYYISPVNGKLIWYIDEAAGSKIS